jgi:hypothetical protein
MSKSRNKKRRALRRPPTEYAAQGSSKRPVRHYENFIAPPTERASMAQAYVVNEIIPVPTRTREEIIRKPVEDVPENFLEPESTRSEISDLSILSSRSRTQSRSSTGTADMSIRSLESIGDMGGDFYLDSASLFSYANPIYEELENRVGFSRPYHRDLNREEISRVSGTVTPFSLSEESIRSSTTESPIIPIRSNESSFIPIRSPENIDTRASISESILASDSQNEEGNARLNIRDIDIGDNRLNYGPIQQQIREISWKISELTSKGEKLNDEINILERDKASPEEFHRVNNQMIDLERRVKQAENFRRLLQKHFNNNIHLFSEPYQGYLMREIERTPTNYQMQLAELLEQDVSAIQSSEAMGATTLTYQYPNAQTDNECFEISIEGDMITVDHLKYPDGQVNCKEPGPRLLDALKAFAEKTNKKLQIGMDASLLTLDSGIKILMAPYKILTKGQSWYNSHGFINIDKHEENVRANKELLDMKLNTALLKAEKILGNDFFLPTFVERMILRDPGTMVKDLVDLLEDLVANQKQTGRRTHWRVKDRIKDIMALLTPLVKYENASLVYVPNSQSFYETYN